MKILQNFPALSKIFQYFPKLFNISPQFPILFKIYLHLTKLFKLFHKFWKTIQNFSKLFKKFQHFINNSLISEFLMNFVNYLKIFPSNFVIHPISQDVEVNVVWNTYDNQAWALWYLFNGMRSVINSTTAY